ncbi:MULTISPECIES: flagellar export chaperone FliS [Virgibacillus]|uniref:Flagellar secretion chaperone FliS n=1 Tax=Virgibacillus dokdonensis TaxID=302167 RepID=A0A2K9J2Q8_9BACI|nr:MULTISPECIES: flagellar export chaperone FliS [Virgibacillus]AUJ23280.1 Flagellar protein FliS [Virgibacillus dokdonensis]NWO14031.1 flagellar export chaperone FliS [Virgibacillus sp.]
MSFYKQHQVYQNNAVNTASPSELTLMLYNGCIKFIKQAMKDIDGDQFEAKNKNIQKAQNIILELMVTLDMEVDISSQFMSLYEYMHHRLTEANTQNDRAALEEVLSFVIEFRDTWKQVILQTRKKQYSKGAQV